MTTTWLISLGSVIAVSLVSLAGAFTLSLREQTLRKVIFIVVSISVGALFGDAFIHLIPEALREGPGEVTVALLILLGILMLFLLEKFLAWQHSHGTSEESQESLSQHDHRPKPLGPLVLISDGLHNFVDGVAIGASYLVGNEVGLATTAAIFLHEIPQEIANFGLLIHSGYPKGRALFYNFLSALTAVAGVTVALMMGGRAKQFVLWILAVVAGNFIYIAGSDLVPQLRETKGVRLSAVQFLAILLGIILMLLLVEVGE